MSTSLSAARVFAISPELVATWGVGSVSDRLEGAQVLVDTLDCLRPDLKVELYQQCRDRKIPVVTGLTVGSEAVCFTFLPDGPDFAEFFACPQNPGLRQSWTLPSSRIMPLAGRAVRMHLYEALNGRIALAGDETALHHLLEASVTTLLLGELVSAVPKVGSVDLESCLREHRDSVWTRMAELYDLILARAPIFTELAGKYKNDLSGCARILEAGAGTGLIAEALAAQGREVHAIDRNLEMLAYARQRGTFLTGEGDVEELFFADEYFDGYLSNNVVLFTNLEQTLQEAHRVLKPGGKLAISSAQMLPDLKAIGGSYDRLVASGIPPEKARRFLDLQAEMIPTSQPHSVESVKAILQKLGFRLMKEDQAYAGINFYLVAEK